MFKIAVLVSGGGSNLQSIIDTLENGNKNYSIEYVIADRECFGIERAEKYGIKTKLFDRKVLKREVSGKIAEFLEDKVDLVVLAGFLSILDEKLVEPYKGRIINIHPSLLPKFGGPGMYGMRVHNAVVEAKENQSGCTVHYVELGVDTGAKILQARVDVDSTDTPEEVARKVLVEEHKLLPRAIDIVLEKLS